MRAHLHFIIVWFGTFRGLGVEQRAHRASITSIEREFNFIFELYKNRNKRIIQMIEDSEDSTLS